MNDVTIIDRSSVSEGRTALIYKFMEKEHGI